VIAPGTHWLTTTEAAHLVHRTPATIRRWARAGHLLTHAGDIDADSLIAHTRTIHAARRTPRGIVARQHASATLGCDGA
jgi:hypothetical protein